MSPADVSPHKDTHSQIAYLPRPSTDGGCFSGSCKMKFRCLMFCLNADCLTWPRDWESHILMLSGGGGDGWCWRIVIIEVVVVARWWWWWWKRWWWQWGLPGGDHRTQTAWVTWVQIHVTELNLNRLDSVWQWAVREGRGRRSCWGLRPYAGCRSSSRGAGWVGGGTGGRLASHVEVVGGGGGAVNLILDNDSQKVMNCGRLLDHLRVKSISVSDITFSSFVLVPLLVDGTSGNKFIKVHPRMRIHTLLGYGKVAGHDHFAPSSVKKDIRYLC